MVTIGLSHTVSEKNGNLSRKLQIFHPRVFCAPLKGFPLELGISAVVRKTGTMGLPDGWKGFKIGLAIYTQYRHVTDIEPSSQQSYDSKDHASRRRADKNHSLSSICL